MIKGLLGVVWGYTCLQQGWLAAAQGLQRSFLRAPRTAQRLLIVVASHKRQREHIHANKWYKKKRNSTSSHENSS